MIVALLAATAFAVLIGLYLEKRSNYDLCEVAEPHTLPGPAGQAIDMDTRFCSPLAGDPGTIVLRIRAAGSSRGTIIFAYNPTNPGPDVKSPPWYPDITWDGPNRVLIKISRLSQLQRQRSEAGEVHFIYQIGKVDYPDA